MIGFLPDIYEDELFYSWLARYYCHSGYNAYSYAIEDFFWKKTVRPDVRFMNYLNDDAESVITRMIPIEKLVLSHTMFPVGRFAKTDRVKTALAKMVHGEGDVNQLLPIPKNSAFKRLRYCPLCVNEDREQYGETYWHRSHFIPDTNICYKHNCRLKTFDFASTRSRTPRLYIAELEVEEQDPEYINIEQELAFVKYKTDILRAPVNSNNNVEMAGFLNAKLEGTPYISIRGKRRNVRQMTEDMNLFFQDMEDTGRIEMHQIEKCMTGYSWNFSTICLIGFFLKIPVEQMTNPVCGETTQTERFDKRVANLYETGIGCHRIAKLVGTCPSTVIKSRRKINRKEHDYSVRRGTYKEDWVEIDRKMIPKVRQVCEQIYTGNGGRPGKVAQATVERMLGMPGKRLNCMRESQKVMFEYYESQEEYWAREVVWAYRKLVAENTQNMCLRRLREITNMRRKDFVACLPYLSNYCTLVEEQSIRNMVMIVFIEEK